jgi:hypothetical protein
MYLPDDSLHWQLPSFTAFVRISADGKAEIDHNYCEDPLGNRLNAAIDESGKYHYELLTIGGKKIVFATNEICLLLGNGKYCVFKPDIGQFKIYDATTMIYEIDKIQSSFWHFDNIIAYDKLILDTDTMKFIPKNPLDNFKFEMSSGMVKVVIFNNEPIDLPFFEYKKTIKYPPISIYQDYIIIGAETQLSQSATSKHKLELILRDKITGCDVWRLWKDQTASST